MPMMLPYRSYCGVLLQSRASAEILRGIFRRALGNLNDDGVAIHPTRSASCPRSRSVAMTNFTHRSNRLRRELSLDGSQSYLAY